MGAWGTKQGGSSESVLALASLYLSHAQNRMAEPSAEAARRCRCMNEREGRKATSTGGEARGEKGNAASPARPAAVSPRPFRQLERFSSHRKRDLEREM